MDGSLLDYTDTTQSTAPQLRPLIADNFAGGGGASTGIEIALGRSPDVAINHDPIALSMHAANHPDALHLTSSVYSVDPDDLVQPGQPVGLAWFSPDCKHHSKAKGGKPLDRNIRDLAWVVVHWAERVRPQVIILENVEEFQDWCPLDANGKADKSKKGETFNKWAKRLRQLGYAVEWKQLKACDYGAPTIRNRLFVIARCDGQPIIWPEPTHAPAESREVLSGKLKPWRCAASIIDWTLPCPSIFDTSAEIKTKHGLRAVRPLADNTLRRIARGVQRYVIDAKDPFFVTYAQHGGRSRSAFDPMHTICASLKDQNAIVMPSLVQVGYGEAPNQKPRALDIHRPLGTVVAGGGKHALVAAFLAQHNGGPNMDHNAGRSALDPVSTITTTGGQQGIVAAHMVNMHGTGRSARDARDPLTTITAGGGHAGLVAAFLTKYYGQGDGQTVSEPAHTLTTRDRLGVVTVDIDGATYAITDIGIRMLTPREQFRAQGFPDSYNIETGADGKPISKTQQTHKCGNSVCPPVAAALVSANCPDLKVPV
ncbi:DNA cytosine methyltransferase [Pseudooceanicola sp. MF1-13]|uniref:DNA cytosine methyltransferase n=1 Tax=Pseudooceanicola sp. MF1-13 TaxID=3379095 RepID=UPI003891B8AD